MLDFGSPFENYNKYSFLNEADDDNNQDQAADNNADNDQGDATPADDTATDNNDTEINTDDSAGDDDFNIDSSDNAPADDDTGTDTGGGDTGSSGGDGGDGSEAGVDTAAKKRDREIFDTLSPEEQKLKMVKLKELYMKLYSRCGQIIEKYDSLGVRYEDLVEPIKNSINALYSLKDTISSYLLYLFDSKSYIENDIMFNRFLVAMNQIKLITKEMRDSHKEEIDAVKSNTPLNDKDIEREKSTPNINKD
jgi:hypothetical protein